MNRSKIKSHSRCGIVLIVTLVILVILASIGYALSASVVTRRHRVQFTMDYQIARYACDSAVKYAASAIDELDTELIERPDYPDFSDVFRLSAEEYQQWLDDHNTQMEFLSDDANDIDDEEQDSEDVQNARKLLDLKNGEYDPDDLSRLPLTFIPGPYEQQWPLVDEPAEFEIGTATVTVRIEDENAKFPLVLALLTEEELNESAGAALETFCEWMQMDMTEIDMLFEQLYDVSDIKQFKAQYLKEEEKDEEKKEDPKSKRKAGRSRRTRKKQNKKQARAAEAAKMRQIDFANLFHSPLIDTAVLSRNTIEDEERTESALKYLGLWGSQKVNINTAPRNVLESVFVFGSLSDSVNIAEAIIRQRQKKPFEDIKELKSSLVSYSDIVDRCEDFITTKSRFFTIKITAVNGLAKITCVVAVKKGGKETELVARRYQ